MLQAPARLVETLLSGSSAQSAYFYPTLATEGGDKENPRTHGRGAWWWNIGGNIWEPSSHPRGESCGDSCPWGPDFVDSNHPAASLNNVLARLKLKSWQELTWATFQRTGCCPYEGCEMDLCFNSNSKTADGKHLPRKCGTMSGTHWRGTSIPIKHSLHGRWLWLILDPILGHFFRHWKDFYLCSPAGYVPAAKRARPSPEGLGTERYGRCLEMLPTNWGYLNRNI